jgi:hypothetical protein
MCSNVFRDKFLFPLQLLIHGTEEAEGSNADKRHQQKPQTSLEEQEEWCHDPEKNHDQVLAPFNQLWDEAQRRRLMRLIWISAPNIWRHDNIYGACRDEGIMSLIDCEEKQSR